MPPPEGAENDSLYPGRPGVIELVDPPLAHLAVLKVLQQNISLCTAACDLHKKVFFIIQYLTWRLSLAYIGWGFAIPATFLVIFPFFSPLPQCEQVVDAVKGLTDVIFIAPWQREAGVVEWQAETWITGFLLLIMANRSWYIFITFLLCLPHILSLVESRVTEFHDMNALMRLRQFFGLVNKLLLLYWAWSSWSASLLVCMLFFPSMSTALIQIAFVTISVALLRLWEAGSALVRLTVPEHARRSVSAWRATWHGAFITYALLALTFSAAVWATWEWSSPYGGIARFITAAAALNVIPIAYLDLAFRLCVLAIAQLLYATSRLFEIAGKQLNNLRGKKKT